MSTWKIDNVHSEIQFKVKHLMISTVIGNFDQFDSTVETNTDNDFNGANVKFSADINSINTKNEYRDNHLKSADFFHAEEHPELKFESTSVAVNGDEVTLNGNLTIRSVTKPITLNGEFGGIITDPNGMTRAGFELEGKINRQDYGLAWSAVTEAGNVVVSDTVKLVLNAEYVKQ